MNSLKIDKNKDMLTHALKKRGFTDNQINYFLNSDYRVFDNYKEYNDDKFIEFYDAYLRLITSEQKITFGDFFNEVGENFKGLLKSKNLSMDDAVGLRLWSSHFYKEILRFKRSLGPTLKIKDMILDDLRNEIYSTFPSLTDAQKEQIMEFSSNVDVNIPQFDFWKLVRDFSDEIGLENVSILGTLERFRVLMKDIEKAICSIDKLTKNRIEENTILYRGVASISKKLDSPSDLYGLPIDEIAYTSTSLTQKASFASRDEYPFCIEIYAPKGTECFDVTPFSKYYKENEFLLAPNELIIFDLDSNYIDQYGNDKILIKALAISKERDCDKNTYLNDELINEEEIFDGKQ